MTEGTMDDLSTGGDRIDYQRHTARRRGPTEIRFRGPDGVLQKAELTVHDEPKHRLGLAMRSVTVAGEPLLQLYVPAKPNGGVDPQAYRRLDAEARALCRFAQVYAARFPDELPRIHGYNVDTAEPYLLIEPLHGRPLFDVIRQFEASDRIVFQQSLLRALALVEQAGFAHGAIDLASLRWDGMAVQLVDFDAASPLDETNQGVDVQAAGMVIRKVVLGPRASADLRNDPPALQALLAGVFDTVPGTCPSARDLLGRLHAPMPQVPFARPEAQFDAARNEFDEACARKRGGGSSTSPLDLRAASGRTGTPGTPDTAPSPSRPAPALIWGLVVAVLVVAAAVLYPMVIK